jgi:hypothetical protein
LETAFQFPPDNGLPGLVGLFNGETAWRLFCGRFGEPEEPPESIHPRYFAYRPGSRALVGYVAQWPQGDWIFEDQFAVEIFCSQPERVFRYPDDPHLPGLPSAASPIEAQQLLSKHLAISPHRLRVEVMRYRPGARAVLRHIVSFRQAKSGRMVLFARVMPPARVDRLLTTAGLANLSGFNLPKIVGSWAEGGVVWIANVKGETVRTAIEKGRAPETGRILDGLEELWNSSAGRDTGRPLDVSGGFNMTEELLSQVLQAESSLKLLDRIKEKIGPFSEAWQPTGPAHNDFYDDQLLITPENELALVDFEEAGPGDPMMDVGNMLAHLRWLARFSRPHTAFLDYHDRIRSDSLARFGWDSEELGLREAYSIFRLIPGPIRNLRQNWAELAETGLTLAAEAL